MEDQKILITATISEAITLASQQNAVPFIRELSITNASTEVFEDLTLDLTVSPNFVTTKNWRIDRISTDSTIHIRDADVALNGQLLDQLNEAVSGKATFRLHKDDDILAEVSIPTRILARNEWGGVRQMAELLAAFSMPNDPAIDKVLKAASIVLQRAGKNDALDGYKSGSRTRVWEVVSAIWSAISNMGISYALPPASFEVYGQKIRTPSQICDTGLGTCLDIVLLFTAALEQAGLNPFIICTKGHAFAGVWLQPDQFSSLIVDNASAIRKRDVLSELVPFEATFATNKPAPSFSQAVEQARKQLSEQEEEKYELAVDIRRARMQKIRPLPAQGQSFSIDGVVNTTTDVGFEAAPKLPDFQNESTSVGIADTPATRLGQWQRRLLDLSLRNPLLNFQATKSSVKFIAPHPALLEDRLAQGKKIKLVAAPVIADGSSERSSAIHLTRHGEDIEQAYAEAALERDEIIVKLDQQELENRVIGIYRTAKNDLEEGGANTLFIAFGFLVWQREGADERKFRAPLVLIPVSLERKSVRGGVRIILGEDEPRFNTTLLQMLRQDFELNIKGLDDALPQDEHGTDISGIWARIREAIKEEHGFEVVEDVVLGTFSFAKYLMWKDLVDRTDQLKRNAVVNHLIETPRETYASRGEFPDIKSLDATYPPERVFTPLPSDSSQLTAVMASSAGKDFVLIGPPGTGKSQTIANMIAQNLAEGRRVLFVAEKATALNVVFKRLKKLGLGEFCLELHSNKARKIDVLDQLRNAWASKEELSSEEWLREAKKLKDIRDELSAYVHRIHEKSPNGFSPYSAIGLVVADDHLPKVKITWPSPDHHSREDIEHLYDLVERLEENFLAVSGVSNTGISCIKATSWSPAWAQQMLGASRELGNKTAALKRCVETLLVALGYPIKPLTADKLRALRDMSQGFLEAYGKNLSFAFEHEAGIKLERFWLGLDAVTQYRQAQENLSCKYADQAWRNFDIDELRATQSIAQNAGWPKSWLLNRKILSILKKKGSAKGRPNIANDLAVFESMGQIGNKIDALTSECLSLPGWACFDTNLDTARRTLNTAITLRKATGDFSENASDLSEVRTKTKEILSEGGDLLAAEAGIGRACTQYLDAYRSYQTAYEAFCTTAANETILPANTVDCLDQITKFTESFQSLEPRLNAWCSWQRIKSEAVLQGLNNFVAILEHGLIPKGKAKATFQKSYAGWWISSVVDRDPYLQKFVPIEHERRIKIFSELDNQFLDLTARYVRAKLCGGLPSEDDAKKGNELGVLRRELEKKRAHKPLRQLISEMPTALTQIAPCLLMSPLSIAQYLAADQAQFDLVIFDEASQITVWDAIGAISRGRNVVVVGDTQQLPPTSFFNRQNPDDASDTELEEDLSSILDECLGAGLPRLELNWHYRSKHESLIAFSNERFYGGNLVTFPSPVTNDRAVRLIPITNSVYDRGASQTNRAEADAIVAEILKRLKDPVFLASSRSIGVVTFNSKQQQLIEDLLDATRSKNPELDRFFDDSLVEEPIFVKNLESVQGDERDIMLFSITYGPDRAGVVRMNFGPLNQQGGPRRLNVAVTRARDEMLVFSGLKSDQIDLSKTASAGVRDLKHFLELAERGPRAIAETIKGSIGGYESPFEEAVAKRLIDLGWRVLPQIGVSTFRIDLGIVHPDAPGKFLAGVECDGATYHRSATVRDRDKLRAQVLRNLGWNIERVWSTDWWIDSANATKRLHERLQVLLMRSRENLVIGEQIEPPIAEIA